MGRLNNWHNHDCPHCDRPIMTNVHEGIPTQLHNCPHCGLSFCVQPRIVKIEYDIIKVPSPACPLPVSAPR
jgi:ribosomal protein L37AE/L43A